MGFIRPILAKSQHHLSFTIPILFPPTSSHCQEPKPYIHFPHPVLSRSPQKDSHDSKNRGKNKKKSKKKQKNAFFRPFSGAERIIRGFLHSIQVNKTIFIMKTSVKYTTTTMPENQATFRTTCSAYADTFVSPRSMSVKPFSNL